MKKEIETIDKGQEEMKNTISELKNTVEGIKSRLGEIQGNKKTYNIHTLGIPEGEEEEQGIENLFEKVMMENNFIESLLFNHGV